MTAPSEERPVRLCIFGAAGDTGNLGVSALLHSALGGVARYAPAAEVTVFDNGWGVRGGVTVHGGIELRHTACGARLSRRVHRPESFAHMRVSSLLGGLGNPGVRAIQEADAVWDISGGDSFGDLYGERRWRATIEPKRLCLLNGVPLVLLPQTYGPFRTPLTREPSVDILRRARLAWARDAQSFEVLRELLGAGFDPQRHRSGVDMAFALEVRAPERPLPDPLPEWLDAGDRPTVGLNISGLIFNDTTAVTKYGLHLDYRALIEQLVRRLLEETDARVVLVPHVIPSAPSLESDLSAAETLVHGLTPDQCERVCVVPGGFDSSETKWILSRLDWFCGTRMHACIGAMSSGTPTLGLAYSLKFAGVFESCGLGSEVAELRSLGQAAALEAAWTSWERREESAAILAACMPAVRARAQEQLEETLAASRRPGG